MFSNFLPHPLKCHLVFHLTPLILLPVSMGLKNIGNIRVSVGAPLSKKYILQMSSCFQTFSYGNVTCFMFKSSVSSKEKKNDEYEYGHTFSDNYLTAFNILHNKHFTDRTKRAWWFDIRPFVLVFSPPPHRPYSLPLTLWEFVSLIFSWSAGTPEDASLLLIRRPAN